MIIIVRDEFLGFMKKFVFGFFILLATLIIGIWSFNSLERPIDTFISPNGKYKVELYGDKRRPWFFTNIVTAKMYSSDKLFASDQLHSGDGFDVSFESAYEENFWTDNNVLSFRGIKNHQLDKNNNAYLLLVTNRTERNIRYLKAKLSRNLFLIFDLEPHSSRTFSVNHSIDQELEQYIYAVGEFENNEKIKLTGRRFSEESKEVKNDYLSFTLRQR